MLESLAWRSLTLAARTVLDRVILEHMEHAGTMNGRLPVTYDDFVRYGRDRRSIAKAVDLCVGLGFLDLVHRGVRAYGGSKRPSVYGLTWLDIGKGGDLKFASNRWKRINTEADVEAVLAKVEALEQERSRDHKRRTEHRERAEARQGTQDMHSVSGCIQCG